MPHTRNEASSKSLSEVFTTIKTLQSEAKKADASNEIREFIELIKHEMGDEAASYLTSIFSQKKKPATNTHPEQAAEYGDYFSLVHYNMLLPYAKLAYLFEKNGSPEEHAMKLSVLFQNPDSALNYVHKQIRLTGFHDSCLFVVPHPTECTFSIWQHLAQKYLAESDFKKLLGQAPKIEAMINEDALQKEGKQSYKAFLNKRKEVTEKHTRWKKLKTNAAEREQCAEEFRRLSRELIDDKNELLALYAGRKLDNNIDLFTLRCYQERYIQTSNQTLQYLLSHGLTTKDHEKFIKLDRDNAGSNIPDELIDGASLGYPGYYLKKAIVQNEAEAARAACLGKLTNCCQSLSGEAGQSCTIHGLTSPNGGFYLLCKGDVNNHQVSDEVIAQSWIWRSKSGALVLDSIEMKQSNSNTDTNKINKTISISMYRQLAKKLCEKHTHKVTCGERSGISSDVSVAIEKRSEEFIDYAGYCDSKYQNCVFDNSKPFYHYEHDVGIQRHIDTFVDTMMESKTPFVESPLFCDMINWLLLNKAGKNKLHEKISKAKNTERGEELQQFMKNMRYFISKDEPNVSKIMGWFHNKFFYHNTINSKGRILLQMLSKDHESLKKILALHPESDGIQAIMEKNDHGDTLLHKSASNPESLKMIIEFLPQRVRLQAIMEENDHEETLLIKVAGNPELLATILTFYPESERLQAVIKQNYYGFTALSRVNTHDYHFTRDAPSIQVMPKVDKRSESLKIILELLPENDRLKALMHISGCNDPTRLIYRVSRKPESLKKILALLPENDRLQAVMEEGLDYAETLIGRTSSKPESLKIIIELLSEKDRIQVMKRAGANHDAALSAILNDIINKINLQIKPDSKLLETDEELMKPLPNNSALMQHDEPLVQPEPATKNMKESLSQIGRETSLVNQTTVHKPELFVDQVSQKIPVTDDPGKEKLIYIIDTLINNIQNQSNGRITNRNCDWKTKQLADIQRGLRDEKGCTPEIIQLYIDEIQNVCAQKRNSLHLWATPHSVVEFEKLLTDNYIVGISASSKKSV